ncbi:IS30 family transposase, partial [Pseudomonas sp. UM16]
MSYSELSVEERAAIQIGHAQGFSLRRIACLITRSPATISRELRRNRDACGGYSARVAQQQMHARRQVCRPMRKLLPGSERFELVIHMLRERLSPEQLAGKLRSMNIPNLRDAYVCRETIYNAIYALPVGELRKELIVCLRQSKTTRRPRAGGVDRRGQIPEMVSIHVRPPEIEDRLMPGHWEGDLIKGKANASSVGTLVERTSGYLMLVKMNDATVTSAMEGFSAALNRMPAAMRKSMTYDHGREMARHAEITQKTGIAIYFCDPHSPWQRGSNENINGLIRQYLPKGTDLSVHSQEERERSTNPTCPVVRLCFTVASPVSSSTAATPRSRLGSVRKEMSQTPHGTSQRDHSGIAFREL